MRLTEAEVGELLESREATHQQRVANGVRLLDAERPDWWKVIDLSTLDINSAETCILAQLHDGDYIIGRLKMGIVCTWAYGFSGDGLSDIWRDVITPRREQAAAAAH